MKPDQGLVSVIVPVFNESGNVAPLHQEIADVLGRAGIRFEIIFVDDGSTDGTLKELFQLSPLKVIALQRNYGQSCALDAGIKNAKGEIIITIDGDGQNDPAVIPALLDKLNEGYDVVCGWRKKRMDPVARDILTKGAALLRWIVVNDGVHDAGCTLRAYHRRCFNDLDLHGGLHRMIPALLKGQGFSITEIPVNHRHRWHGQTKYTWTRIFQGLRDLMYVWSWRHFSRHSLRTSAKYSIKDIHELGK